MATSIASKLNLPNKAGGQNPDNLVSEYDEYVKLYKNWNRTTTGQYSIGPLASSGKSYSTSNYPNDADVWNRGMEGMISLLYKYVLKNYIVDVDVFNELYNVTKDAVSKAEDAITSSELVVSAVENMSVVYDVVVSNNNGSYTVTSGLPNTLPIRIFDIRFISPSVCANGNTIRLVKGGSVIPVKTINGKSVPEGIWAKDSVVQLTINNMGATPTATLSGGGSGSGFLISTTAPTDKGVMWIDSANGYYAKVWDGSSWVGISAAWG